METERTTCSERGGRPFLSLRDPPPPLYVYLRIFFFLISGFSRRCRINGCSRARDIHIRKARRAIVVGAPVSQHPVPVHAGLLGSTKQECHNLDNPT